MEEATGAPSSLTVCKPRRLRASGRDGEPVMTEPPSPLSMLLFRHTRRGEFFTLIGGAAAWPVVANGQPSTIPLIGYLDASGLAARSAPPSADWPSWVMWRGKLSP